MKHVAKKSNTLSILEKYNLNASKKFGQNFLVDENIVAKIIRKAEVTKDTTVIEVGPGIGALTEALAHQAGYVKAFEIDERLKPVLEETVGEYSNVEVFFQDFLKVDLEEVILECQTEDLCLISNLPYYVTTDMITKVVQSSSELDRMIVMVQKETAMRLTGKEKSPLRFMIDHVGSIETVMQVPRNVFSPAPHIDSTVLKIAKKRSLPPEMAEVLKTSFTAKRKTIANNLKPLFKEETQEVLKRLNISPTLRPEQLTVKDYEALASERKHK